MSAQGNSLTANWGLVPLRLVVGLVFIVHGGQKLFVFGLGGAAGFMAKVGIPWPFLAAVVVIAVEIPGGRRRPPVPRVRRRGGADTQARRRPAPDLPGGPAPLRSSSDALVRDDGAALLRLQPALEGEGGRNRQAHDLSDRARPRRILDSTGRHDLHLQAEEGRALAPEAASERTRADGR